MSFNVNPGEYLLAEVVCFQAGLGLLSLPKHFGALDVKLNVRYAFLLSFATVCPSKRHPQLLRLREPSADGSGVTSRHSARKPG